MPAILLDSVAAILIVGIVFSFLNYNRKLKDQLLELESKKEETNELLINAQQLNKNLVQESLIERGKVEELMSKMNFEIHNCVNVIMGITTLLKDTELNKEQQKNTDIIISCSKKLLEAADSSFNPDSTKKNAKTNSVNNSKLKTVQTHREKVSKEFYQKYPLSVLVAEDDNINQQLSLRLLEKLGYRADIATNGKEALEMVSERNYDVILMDVQMPEMDGFEATKMIRLCLDAQPIIIALTASAMAGDKERCVEAGMNDYLCKPINLEELADMFVRFSDERKLVS